MCFYNTRPHIPYYEEHLVDPYAPPPAEPLGVREVYVNADSTTPNAIDLAYCFHDHEQDSHSLTYSVSGGDPSIATAYMSSATVVSFQGGGTPGVTSVTVTATDWYGATGQMTISVYACRVTGYEVQERAWGQDWGDPEDADKTSNWAVLWRSDYQKWLPKVEPQAVQNKITGVNWSYAPEGSTYYQSFANTDSFAWCYGIPYAEFEKWALDGGEDDYDRLGLGPVEIRPSVVFGAIDRAYLNRGTCVSMVDTGPSADQPDISMHDVSSVQWVPQLEQTTVTVDGLAGSFSPERNLSKLSGGVAFPNPTYDEFLVDVQITPAIPSRMMGTVWLAWYDPCDFDDDFAGYTDNAQGMQWIGPKPLEFVGSSDTDSQTKGVFAIVWQDPTKIGVGDDYVVAAHPRDGAELGYNWKEATMCGCGTGQWILYHEDYNDPLNDSDPIPGYPAAVEKPLASKYQTPVITVGAEIFINHDDDTKNGIPDLDDPTPLTTFQDRDLYRVETGIQQTSSQWEVHLVYSANLTMWGSQTKDPVPGLLSTYTPIEGDYTTSIIRSDQFTDNLYFEGTELGTASVQWHLLGNGHVTQADHILLDVVPTTWKGWDVPAGWRISHTREEQVLGQVFGNEGVIQTPYPKQQADGDWEAEAEGPDASIAIPKSSTGGQSENYTITVDYEFASDGLEESDGQSRVNQDCFADTTHSVPRVGFFANSGIKIERKCEIQIYDTHSLVTALTQGNDVWVDGQEVTVSRDPDYHSVDPNSLLKYGVDGATGEVHVQDDSTPNGREWAPVDYVNKLVTGIPYGVGEFTEFSYLNTPGDSLLTVDVQCSYYGGSLQSRSGSDGIVSMDSSDHGFSVGDLLNYRWEVPGSDPTEIRGGSFVVSAVNGSTVSFTGALGELPGVGEDLGVGGVYELDIAGGPSGWGSTYTVPLTGNGAKSVVADGRVWLQAHWGSVVIFTDADVEAQD